MRIVMAMNGQDTEASQILAYLEKERIPVRHEMNGWISLIKRPLCDQKRFSSMLEAIEQAKAESAEWWKRRTK